MHLPGKLPTAIVPARTILWRVHQKEHDPVWFGPNTSQPPRHRFDAQAHEYQVCYFGDSREGAIVETLIRALGPIRVVARKRLAELKLSQLPVRKSLRLARLEGAGLVRLGLDANQVHSDDYTACRELAHAIWSHLDRVDGIQYRSRWDNSRLCVALFDRARSRLGAPVGTLSLGDATVILSILDRYDIGIV